MITYLARKDKDEPCPISKYNLGIYLEQRTKVFEGWMGPFQSVHS
jgi:hypothetical protein